MDKNFIKPKIFIFFLLILAPSLFYGMALTLPKKPKGLPVYAIPGERGLGSETDYIRQLLNQEEQEIIRIETPKLSFADLGQSFCLHFLEEELKKPGIVHGSGQGTGTVLNALADDKEKNNIKALILESVFASGNTVIEHSIYKTRPNLGWLFTVPCAYYWIPYLFKILFPFYWPAGKQPIKSVERISTTIPIIIIHSEKDPFFSIDDARALYYGLCFKGNKNVYLITMASDKHLWLALGNDSVQQCIRTILHENKLLHYENEDCLIKDASKIKAIKQKYQPNHLPFKSLYKKMLAREKKHEYLAYGVATLWIMALLVYLYDFYPMNVET